MSGTRDDLFYNPFQPGFTDDPYPHYAELRAADPVHATPFGVWMLFAYDDVVRVLREPGLSVDERNAHDTPLTELANSVVGPDRRRQGEHAMINRDPPDHTRLRRLVSKAFTPRTVQQLEGRVQALVDTSLDAAASRGSLELMRDLAFPLPFAVISEMLGMPDGVEADEIRSLSGLLVRSLEPVLDPDLLREIAVAGDQLYGILSSVITAKRAQPGDDLLSALIAAEEDGDRLSTEELADQVALLYVAGHETTVNLIGNGIRALLDHPDQLAALRDEPGLIQNAVEEMLRFDSPVQMTRRITLQPLEVRGRSIEPGAFVVLGLGSSNRDPDRWGPTADVLDLRRDGASNQLSFGGGHHYCLGAALARLEAQVAIGSLVRRFPTIEPTAEPVWNGRINLRGLEALPLAVS